MKIHFVIAVAGFIVSLLFSFFIYPQIQVPLNLSIDPDRYGEIAYNLYSGSGFKYSNSSKEIIDRPPAYPYLLALIFYFSNGVNYYIVQIVQALFHSLTTLMIFYSIRGIVDSKTAVLAQMIVALHPMLIWYTSRIWIESFYIMIFLATSIYYIKTYNSLKLINSIIAGLLTGITLLTKSVLLLFPVLLIFFFYFKKGAKGLISALIIIFVSSMILLPWTIRNYHLTNSFIPVNLNLGQNLILGNALAQSWKQKPLSNIEAWEEGYQEIQLILNNSQNDNYSVDDDNLLISNYLNSVFHNPEFFIWRTFINFITFWYLSESPLKSIFFVIMQFPLLLILIMGIKKLIREFEFSWIFLLIVVYYSVVHAFIIGWGRYSVPLIPIIIIMVILILKTKKVD